MKINNSLKSCRGDQPVAPAQKVNGNKGELEDFICAEFIEHDIMFLSELLRNISIDIACPFCTATFEQLMAVRGDLVKELNKLTSR